MKALILIGGFGMRLKPLTLTVPKPLVEFANKPILCYQIEALVKIGVTEIILCINYQPEVMAQQVREYEDRYNVKITQIQEEEPLGTAGPIKHAREQLLKDATHPFFFVMNSDIVCEFNLDQLLEFHISHGKEASMYMTTAEDPSKYGVIVADENGRVSKFVEKPKEFVGSKVNAGLYIINNSLLDQLPKRPCMLETDIFPKLAEDGSLYVINLKGFWMDVGQPKDFMNGTKLYLQYLKDQGSEDLARGDNIIGNVLIHPSARVDPSSVIGPNVVIGEDCVVWNGVRISESTIFGKTQIKGHAFIRNSLIGWQSIIGQWVRIEGVSVVAEDVQIKDVVFINESFILPHKNITSSIPNPSTIVM
ncbi:mannose-1-phosphate guanyltransferase [Stylonychia lemnae]|uniref:mannose-1-phosphate guanylyltransferase n=1 Tax=Stylonychia lemnae TaxID=5949 RepID=A0A078ALQ8_STYLE|nr:mannose-1-phosphate guanyltransferase [Stylonychia lemnae]|eukprot:CDW81783.1 mannose-1-phosphate guanyltransferase [Stylonychia lemnae]